MTTHDGFLLKPAAVILVLAVWTGCGTNSAPSNQATNSDSETSPRAQQTSFDDIRLPTATVSITRESASPFPNEILRLSVRIAGDAQSRGRGLMGVEDLPSSSGMVFLYDRPSHGSFYMKNTLIALDIAFWGEDRQIHEILQMQPCKKNPCPTYSPQLPFIGALEVNKGLFAEKGVKVGDVVTVTAQTTGR